MKTNKMQKLKILKIIVLIIFIIAITLVALKLFPIFANLGTPEGQQKFKVEITNQGFNGAMYLIGLQLLQILVPVLPGEPIEFLAGICYGTWLGLLLILIGAFLSSTIIFFSVRKLGKDFIITFLGKEKVEQFENSKFFADSKKIYLILFILFFIPGTPKDLLTYIAGLLPLKPYKFLLISTFARIPSIITSTFAGSNLIAR